MIQNIKKLTILIILAVIIIPITACQKKDEQQEDNIPDFSSTSPVEYQPKSTSKPADEEKSSPKLSGEISKLPTFADIESLSGYVVTSVLASDALEYELPLNENFAVALREDITKGVRWLLASEDGKYKLLNEQHINGYRVFVFSSDFKGETNMVYELASGDTVAETLSYHLFLGTPGGDR